jgi:hypothetical protein
MREVENVPVIVGEHVLPLLLNGPHVDKPMAVRRGLDCKELSDLELIRIIVLTKHCKGKYIFSHKL